MSEMTASPEPTPERLRQEANDLEDQVRPGDIDLDQTAELLRAAAHRIEMAADRMAVTRFASLMTVKMARKLSEGRHGWTSLPVAHLWAMLREHIEKGDPIDIAILAMMIQNNTETHPR